MNRSYTRYIPFFLIFIFLFPSVVKLEHHHQRTGCCHSEKSCQTFHENCPICDFHFSIFTDQIQKIDLEVLTHFDRYKNQYNTPCTFSFTNLPFSHRAPPFS
ncbi:MAG: hypothetical protein PWQ71_283 [Bacteroidota bacterium]|nr:hypothetical protein [Bacteroidota bacterium]